MRENRFIPWGARGSGEPAGKGISVFVIDSGVNPSHSHVQEISGGARVFREPGGEIRCVEGDFQDNLGHGTAITAVIRHVAPASRIFAIKIFSASLHATVDVLEAAMTYAMKARARVINLSLGIGQDVTSRPIGSLCRRAAEEGIVLVASARNGFATSGFPALLPEVIGVAADGRLGERSLRYFPGEPLECRASGWPRELPGLPRERNFRGNSFAAARVSGVVACILEGRPAASLDEVRRILEERYG